MNKLKERFTNRKKGFTLIELLVVIAVLGILVLLAAPRFLGYTKDAHVATMKADAKILSNSALIYNIEEEGTWPVAIVTDEKVKAGTVMVKINDAEEAEEVTLYKIDKAAISDQVKNLKNDIDAYGIAIDNKEIEGEVFHIEGVEGRNGDKHFGVDTVVEKPAA